ncbi:SAS complex subunit [Teratosphaeriaceae sp. CCFEE 6253]|nr:SAS complex subunit [Teratosphaeriaceae sp. CCFEE 6253]
MAVTMSATSPSTLLSPNRAPKGPPMQPNVANVVLGEIHIKPWYPSFYPEDLLGGRKTEWLYVCQWCFRYTSEIVKYSAHCKVCPLRNDAPPGDVVYEKDQYVIHELDGADHNLYAQNLSLLSKLFLDTKSVFFDVSTFLYYPLILRSPSSTGASSYGQVVGFFSKEKMSWDNNNVACILVFPPWQRQGLGQVLIAASYELGRREGRFGGPERPLSALGKKGYLGYWCGEVYRFLMDVPEDENVTVGDVSAATYIMQEDIVAALAVMKVANRQKMDDGSVEVNKTKLRAWAGAHGVGQEPLVDADAFIADGSEEEESGAGE